MNDMLDSKSNILNFR